MKTMGISQVYDVNYAKRPCFNGDMLVSNQYLTELAVKEMNNFLLTKVKTRVSKKYKTNLFNTICSNINEIRKAIINKYSPMAHFNTVQKSDGINIVTNINRKEDFGDKPDFKFYYYDDEMTYIDVNDVNQIEDQREGIELKLIALKKTILEYFRNIHQKDTPNDLRYTRFMDKPAESDPYNADKIKQEYDELLKTRQFYNDHKELATDKINKELALVISEYEIEMQRIKENEIKAQNIALAVDTSAITSLISYFSKAVDINPDDIVASAMRHTNEALKSKKGQITSEKKQKIFDNVISNMKDSIDIIQNEYSPLVRIDNVCKSGSDNIDIVTSIAKKYRNFRHENFNFYFYDNTKRSLDIYKPQEIRAAREDIELNVLETKNQILQYYKDVHGTSRTEKLPYTNQYHKSTEADPYNKDTIEAEYKKLLATRDFYKCHKELLTNKIKVALNKTINAYKLEIQKIKKNEVDASNLALPINVSTFKWGI